MKKPTLFTVSRTVHTDLNGALKKLKKMAVYVGIPRGSEKDERKDGPMLNSDLGWIHEKGAPSAGIPPRPFLAPGVMSVRERVSNMMGNAVKMALSNDEQSMKKQLDEAGGVAADAVRNYVNEGKLTPLKPASIKNRKRSRNTESSREGEKDGTATIVPLINTNALVGAVQGLTVEE